MRLPLFVGIGVFAACGSPQGLPSALNEPVTLVISLDRSRFAPTATLEVRVWNAEQLTILDNNARCTAVADRQTGVTRHVCPDGIEYREPSPERFDLPVRTLSARPELKTTSVRAGERFRVRLSALSRDNCNTTSADRVLTARSARVFVDNLDWQTTAKGCLKGAPV